MWWEILGLDASADQKAIKLAYARKLKQTRPDDDPEGFKELHDAYKQALSWYEHQQRYGSYEDEEEWEDEDQATIRANQSTSPPLEPAASAKSQPTLNELSLAYTAHQVGEQANPLQAEHLTTPQKPFDTDDLELQSTVLKASDIIETPADESMSRLKSEHLAAPQPSIDTEFLQLQLHSNLLKAPPSDNNEQAEWDDLEAQFEKDWRSFQNQFSTNIHTETARKDPQYWAFLEALPSFFDLEFRERLSHELFGFISESNLKASEQKTLFIKKPVLDYLNSLFNWEQQWRSLTELFGERQADAILLHIEATQVSPKNTTRVQPEKLHYYSRFLAFVIDVLLLLCLGWLMTSGIGLTYNPDIGFNPYPLFLSFLAIPIMEASTWQASLGKRVMGLKVVNKQGQRLTLPHAYWRFFVTLVCIIGFKIVVWINLFLAYKCNMLLQDWATQSYVMKKH